MYTLFAILIIITCVLLILIIMIQNPKGGGLSSAFGGGNQIMGARKTSDFLEKTTWTLAIVLVSLALLSNFSIPRNNSDEQSIIENSQPETSSAETKTASGIIIPDSAQEKPQKGQVIAVGPGTKENPITLKVGDNILYGKYSGTELKHDGIDYLIMKESDILAKI